MEKVRCERIGRHRLYLGDCGAVMPTLGEVHALVTDPPYGIGYDQLAAKTSGKSTRGGRGKGVRKSEYATKEWDCSPAQDLIDLALKKVSDEAVIWGGNYYDLPAYGQWLVWDKENGTTAFSDCELAWTNRAGPIRMRRHLWNGMLRKGQEPRHGHPTQKPIDLMVWCLSFVSPESVIVLDPFMGSGTTGVACQKMGKVFIGIEQDPEYFEIACQRLREAVGTPDWFAPEPPASNPAGGS